MVRVQIYLMNSLSSIGFRPSAEDDIHKTTRGAVKPSKHMLLGMGLKSITGSRKVQEIVNHLGHCIGYHTVEEYEIQIAVTIIEK